MATVQNPYITGNLEEANVFQPYGDRAILVTGQMTDAATATEGALYENVEAMPQATVEALFGINSQITNTILYCRLGATNYVRIDAIAKSDAGAATAGNRDIAFAGTTAGAAGTYIFEIIDGNKPITVSIAEGDDPTDAGDALVAALAQNPNLAATGANATGTVTVTATNKGGIGNYGKPKVTGEISGLTVTIGGAFVGGATDPTLTGLFDVCGENRYTRILFPEAWRASDSILIAYLESIFQVTNIVQDGVGIIGVTDTYANSKAIVDALNTHVVVYMGCGKVDDRPAVNQPADYAAAYFAGVGEKRLTTGADIRDVVFVTENDMDNTGGIHISSLPYYGTVLKEAPYAPSSDMFSTPQQLSLSESGFTVYGTKGRNVVMGEVVTPYTKDALGNDNNTYHILNYIDTGSGCREYIVNATKIRFAQARITDGAAGDGVENDASIKAFALEKQAELVGKRLLKAGSEAAGYRERNTAVTVDIVNRTVTINITLQIIIQASVFDYTFTYVFDTNS